MAGGGAGNNKLSKLSFIYCILSLEAVILCQKPPQRTTEVIKVPNLALPPLTGITLKRLLQTHSVNRETFTSHLKTNVFYILFRTSHLYQLLFKR